jgi:hypothetical protein
MPTNTDNNTHCQVETSRKVRQSQDHRFVFYHPPFLSDFHSLLTHACILAPNQIHRATASFRPNDVLPSRQKVIHRQTQRLTLRIATKRLLSRRPLKISHSRIHRTDRLPAPACIDLRSGIHITSSMQVRRIRVRIVGAGETDPVIHHRLCKRRVVWISFRQAKAAPGTEDLREIAGVAFEVFAFWVAIRVSGGLRGVAEFLHHGQH